MQDGPGQWLGLIAIFKEQVKQLLLPHQAWQLLFLFDLPVPVSLNFWKLVYASNVLKLVNLFWQCIVYEVKRTLHLSCSPFPSLCTGRYCVHQNETTHHYKTLSINAKGLNSFYNIFLKFCSSLYPNVELQPARLPAWVYIHKSCDNYSRSNTYTNWENQL